MYDTIVAAQERGCGLLRLSLSLLYNSATSSLAHLLYSSLSAVPSLLSAVSVLSGTVASNSSFSVLSCTLSAN